MITQINNFSITQLSFAANAQFHKQVNNKITAYDPVVLHIEELVSTYAAAVAAEMKAVNRPTSLVETALMANIDRKRDQSISMIVGIIDLHKRSTKADELAAAHRLDVIAAPYSGIQTDEYYKETTKIDGFAVALAEALPEDITLLGLSSAIEQMTMHNSTFKRLFEERTGDLDIRTPVRLTETKELRNDADTSYRGIRLRVNAFAIAIPSPELEAFAMSINSIILQLQKVLAHQGKGGTEETEEEVALREAEEVLREEEALRGADSDASGDKL